MNYEKKYKETLERAKSMIKVAANQDEAIGFANTIFPELKESEDERIRKTLIEYFNAYPKDYFGGLKKSYLLAWLEKQGEKKSIWSEKDDGYKLVALSAFLNYYDEENPLRKCLINWLKSLKQRMGG